MNNLNIVSHACILCNNIYDYNHNDSKYLFELFARCATCDKQWIKCTQCYLNEGNILPLSTKIGIFEDNENKKYLIQK
jgi:hypothetical protein